MSIDLAGLTALREHLAAIDPALRRAHRATPDFPWRVWEGGYAGLIKIIVGQQVSVAAAEAIWARLETGLGEVSPARVLEFDIEGLKAFSLSRPKARYALAVAEAQVSGAFDFAALPTLDDETALAALVALPGVGRWTAEVYLMLCEGRLDFFPAGDIALQEALRMTEEADARLDTKALYARAEVWKPHRGVAAHLLWAYYVWTKQGKILV